MDKVSDTPRTNFVAHATGDAEWNRSMNRFGRMMAHACILERELAALKEQVRVLEDEMLVLGDARNAAEARSNLLACALRSLLSKCACCGGTGEVATGHIQMGIPFITSCCVCEGERGILLKECGK
jgi:hypothetical protein